MKRLLIASLFILGGCSSPQVVNYTLTPVSDQVPSVVAASTLNVQNINSRSNTSNLSGSVPYRLDRVTVPPQSDDLSLVVRDGNDRLLVLTYDRWTVSLTDEFTQALALTLSDEIGMPPTQVWSLAATNLPHNDLKVDVRRFEMLPGQSANLSVSWNIKATYFAKARPKLAVSSVSSSASNLLPGSSQGSALNASTNEPVRSAPAATLEVFELTCFASFSHAVEPGVLPLVQAQQKNIRQLSQKIAQTLQVRQGVEGVTCR
jgi:uncharacterized lipoprotein YmbA